MHEISLLYVEDEPVLRSIYQKILEKKVRAILLAENGEDAFNKYLEFKPDLIITDIKMPVMNGLDLVRKVRKENPNARIIIMSAYGESHYFMRAIENGVKGFLLKPVNNEKLFLTIDEQARDILMERNIHEEEKKRRTAEEALLRNERVLQTVSDAAETLLKTGYTAESINQILIQLGQAAQVSRAYIFENFEKEGIEYSKQTYEWVSEGVSIQLDNEELQAVPLHNSPISRWSELLGKRQIISGSVESFPKQEREILEPQNIISLLAVPIFVQDKWHGFVGFDDCFQVREWTTVEINAIITAANILGSAIHRENIESELKVFNAELESRVFDRTRQLENQIAEKNLAEALLRDSEEKYRLIFENANDGIFLSSHQIIQFINPKAYEITGYLPKHVIGRDFSDFIHPDFKPVVLKNHYDRMAGHPVPESYDIQIITSDMNVKWVEIKSNRIIWDGTPAVLTFLTDIQKRKENENELRELNLHLEDRVKQELDQLAIQQELLIQKNKLESLGELSAGMSHEINQPLGGISFSLDNILNELLTGELSHDYLKKKINLIFSDIERIQNIINHVRLFSRDHQDVKNETFDLNQIIHGAKGLVSRQYSNQKIDIQLQLSNDALWTSGSPFQLEQVLLNMLSNSKYALEKKTQNSDSAFVGKILLKTWKSNNYVFLSVEDNGSGIPPEILKKVFDPFFTTKVASEGTGLGLSISYGIIKRMKGEIKAESKFGEFTLFTISLPEEMTS